MLARLKGYQLEVFAVYDVCIDPYGEFAIVWLLPGRKLVVFSSAMLFYSINGRFGMVLKFIFGIWNTSGNTWSFSYIHGLGFIFMSTYNVLF